MTNGDWFRSLSDNQIARMLYKFCWNGEHCYDCPLYNADCAGVTGPKKWFDWVEQTHIEEEQ